MKFNADYYDTDFEISYKGSRIHIKNDGPEGERLFINGELQDQNFEAYDGYLKGSLINEEGEEETIEVYLGGPQTSNCIIEANGKSIYASFPEPRLISQKEEKPKRERKPSLLLPFIMILLAAIIMVIVLPLMGNRKAEGSSAKVAETMEALESTGQAVEASVDFIEREYSWNYGKNQWTYNMKIPSDAYQYYKSVDRKKITNYSYYVTDLSDDEYLSALGQKFKEEAEKANYSDYDMVKNIILFVQNLNYVDDKVDTGYDEYPKFPLETLVDEGGDCEDSAILLASLLRELGFGAVLIQFPEHMGVGVRGEDSLSGTFFEIDEIRYYYIETTSPGWEIGELPQQLENQPARILSLVR